MFKQTVKLSLICLVLIIISVSLLYVYSSNKYKTVITKFKAPPDRYCPVALSYGDNNKIEIIPYEKIQNTIYLIRNLNQDENISYLIPDSYFRNGLIDSMTITESDLLSSAPYHCILSAKTISPAKQKINLRYRSTFYDDYLFEAEYIAEEKNIDYLKLQITDNLSKSFFWLISSLFAILINLFLLWMLLSKAKKTTRQTGDVQNSGCNNQ